jgi:autotransporter passenger strand-loop-strand repeat protein
VQGGTSALRGCRPFIDAQQSLAAPIPNDGATDKFHGPSHQPDHRLRHHIVESGGVLEVLSGGLVSGLISVSSGGTTMVTSGGTTLSATISGGVQFDYSFASGVTIFTGSQVVESGGVASGTVICGGEQIVSGGTASSTTIVDSNGAQYVGCFCRNRHGDRHHNQWWCHSERRI